MKQRSTIITANAHRYMTQLSKHWAHKFKVAHDSEASTIQLPLGDLVMFAHDDRLELEISGAEQADLVKLVEVVEQHLERFAFREAPLDFNWQSVGASQATAS